jgi:hypothetical protein
MMALSWGTPLMKSRSRINRSIRRAPIAPRLLFPMNAKLDATMTKSNVLKLHVVEPDRKKKVTLKQNTFFCSNAASALNHLPSSGSVKYFNGSLAHVMNLKMHSAVNTASDKLPMESEKVPTCNHNRSTNKGKNRKDSEVRAGTLS